MKQYNKFRKHIEKNVVPEGGDVIKELDRIRDVLNRLQDASKELMEFCIDNGHIDRNDESEGYYEWELANSEALEILK